MEEKKNTKKKTVKKNNSKKSPAKTTKSVSKKSVPVKKSVTKKTTQAKKSSSKNQTSKKSDAIKKKTQITKKKVPVKKANKPIKKVEVSKTDEVKESKYRFELIRLIVRLLIFIVLIISLSSLIITDKEETRVKGDYSSQLITNYKEDLKNKCLESREIPIEVRSKIQYLETDLIKYLSSYNISLKYGEFNNDYEISYRSNEVYYGASLIKLVDALYLLENNVDLSITKKYESRFKMGYSSKVSTYKIGDSISLRDLISYAISVSDNSAHLMLIDYIGFNNLQKYAQKLGGKVILDGGDLFGNQTADDMAVYLKKAYEVINQNENGSLIKDAMLNTEVNYLNFDDVVLGHKYGSYNSYFHDVGINFNDEPYYIAVLSTLDRNKKVITEVSKRVYNIHKSLIQLKTDYCNSLTQ